MSKTTRFEMRMDPETLAAIQRFADKEGISRAALIDRAIARELARLEADRPKPKRRK
jgi:hypothetical protein